MHNDPLNPTGPNEMLFARQTCVCQRYYCRCTMALLANASEPFVCGGDAAFSQMTLTT